MAQAMAGAMQEAMQGMASNLAAAVATAVVNIPKFRPPNDDEADPASPEHEAYLKAKEAWEKEQKAKMEQEAEARKNAPAATASTQAAAASLVAAATAGGGSSAADAAFNEALQTAIRNMNDLWGRAYSCQAAAIHRPIRWPSPLYRPAVEKPVL